MFAKFIAVGRTAARPAAASSRILAGPAVHPRVVSSRSLHVSAPVLKKRKSTAHESEDQFETSDDLDGAEDELFGTSDLLSAASSRAGGKGVSNRSSADRSALRAALIASIHSTLALPLEERRLAMSSDVRVGTLRKIVQLTGSEEEVLGLKSVLRAWREVGGKVTGQTAKELVGRCCNLGRPDLAKELVDDRIQYGVPELHQSSQTRLLNSLSQYVPKTESSPSSAEAAATA